MSEWGRAWASPWTSFQPHRWPPGLANPWHCWGGTTAGAGYGGEQTQPSPPATKHALPCPLWQQRWQSGAGSFVPAPRNDVYSIPHNLFSIDSQWICFSTTDDLARKQIPLKQEPSKTRLGCVRHPWVHVMPRLLFIATGPSSWGW